MATAFPYTHYACPCSDLTSAPIPPSNKRASIQPAHAEINEEQTFNPHNPRANYALYPLETLLFCDECDAPRCPRCCTEEVIYWYCPQCLFEVPSSIVRGDGCRCSRSCYDCPSCAAPLAVTQITKDDGLLNPGDAANSNETYVLQCQYCDWNSLEIDVQFSKPMKITEQLAKQRKVRISSSKDKEPPDNNGEDSSQPRQDETFTNLANFYKEQLSESAEAQNNPFSNSPYSSPANLARIMSLYGGLSRNALKKSNERPHPMREALARSEGLAIYNSDDLVDQMQRCGWESTATSSQRLSTPVNNEAKFIDQLWPAATPLRTRRGKRCKTCRQFLARPEPKVGSMRFKIRLLAMNHMPRLSIRPLNPAVPPASQAFDLRNDATEQEKLQSYQTKQYILTVRNPIFETVKVSLATPATTPGKVASRVTILCPVFSVGPAGDVWDEALSASNPSLPDGGPQAAMVSLTGSSEGGGDRQPEAGKIWEKTRNSTSVIIEIVPGSLGSAPSIVPKTEQELAEEALGEDDDVLEVPVYVRTEWEADVKPGESVAGKKDGDRQPGERVRKQLEYWVVLGVGQIAG